MYSNSVYFTFIHLFCTMSIKRLAGHTAIYGLSSVLGRVLYFLLTPLYVRVFDTDVYGVVTDLFSFIGLALIFFTYRFETAYFRYASDHTNKKGKIYDTALISLVVSGVILAAGIFTFQSEIAASFKYPEYSYLIGIAAFILLLDTVVEIPLSYLRLTNQSTRFAVYRLIGIGINIGLNLFFLLLCPYLIEEGVAVGVIRHIYNPDIGIGYIFISNLAASAAVLMLLMPTILKRHFEFDWTTWRNMMVYALPLIIVGLSFSINELLDRKIMIWLLSGTVEENKSVLGAYGACYKLTMILALFTQAFRYGAEPFFFEQKKSWGAELLYARVTKYYIIIAVLGCLFTLLYLDQLKYILEPSYWLALGVIPILLLANLFNGIYYNISIWYRLKDKTIIGAAIATVGAVITIVLNIWWLPIYGFWGAAWATLICYGTMTVICYAVGKKYYPIPYDVGNFLFYLTTASAIYIISIAISTSVSSETIIGVLINTALLLVFITVVYFREKKQINVLINGWISRRK